MERRGKKISVLQREARVTQEVTRAWNRKQYPFCVKSWEENWDNYQMSATVNLLMKEHSLSASELATRSGLHISTMHRAIRGAGKYVEPDTVLNLVRGLGVSYRY